MPNSIVTLKFYSNQIDGELQLPLGEFQFAFGHHLEDSAEYILKSSPEKLISYFQEHIQAVGKDGRKFKIEIGEIAVSTTKNEVNGVYREMIVQFKMIPPTGQNPRQFIFDYDVIVHQLISHKILVALLYDWRNGMIDNQDPIPLGVIELDVPTGEIKSLEIELNKGSFWKGCFAFFKLGIEHIAAGLDHLVFLLVLLLPAPLVAKNKRWVYEDSHKHSFLKVLKLVTAFTIGHSLSLTFGVFVFQPISTYLIEILIAVTIFISSYHSMKPIFPSKEIYITALFGLIHGMAFANSVVDISTDNSLIVFSIVSFNLGIEFFQLVLLFLLLPIIFMIGKTKIYSPLRLSLALIGMSLSLFWLIDRI